MDPFKDYHQRRRARSTLDDVPMPDYIGGSSSASSRAISNMTGISYEAQKAPSVTAPIDDEQYNQLIEAFSPSKKPNSGTHAPTNTPSSGPPIVPKPSAAAEARSASYSRGSGRPKVLKEISQPSTRDPSGSSAPGESLAEPLPARRVGASPSASVRSRKEEVASLENKENDGEDRLNEPPSGNSGRASRTNQRINVRADESINNLSESKRKRSSGAAASVVLQTERGYPVDSSPSKKVSRLRVSTDSTQGGSFEDFLEHGTPLGIGDDGSAEFD